MLIKIFTIVLAISYQACIMAERHWAVGGWDCRSWGAIRLLDDRYAIDLDPEGCLNDWGVWQDFDQHSVLIVWQESSRREVINKSGDKFYHQMAYSFGIASQIQEIRKILKE
jgi:hypothetical protein